MKLSELSVNLKEAAQVWTSAGSVVPNLWRQAPTSPEERAELVTILDSQPANAKLIGLAGISRHIQLQCSALKEWDAAIQALCAGIGDVARLKYSFLARAAWHAQLRGDGAFAATILENQGQSAANWKGLTPQPIAELLKTALDYQRSTYRILFPTGDENKKGDKEHVGYLLWAEVAVRERPPSADGPKGIQLLLAPWTFFLPDREDFNKLWESFKTATQCLLPKPGVGTVGPEYDCLLSVHPLRPEDFGQEKLAERLGNATVLTPPALSFKGESLGVAVALAAAAASAQRRIRPLIATGEIDTDGNILPIYLGDQKLRAWHAYGAKLESRPLFLFPSENGESTQIVAAGLGLDDTTRQKLLIPVDNLEKLRAPKEGNSDFYTDGFDGYREHHRALTPPDSATTETSDRFQAVQPTIDKAQQRLFANEKSPEAAAPPLVDWFGEDPVDLARRVADGLRADWIPTEESEWFATPVVIELTVAQLLGKGDWPTNVSLARQLSSAVAEQVKARPASDGKTRLMPSEADFETALQRPNKLVLIVHDLPSVVGETGGLWAALEESREARKRLVDRLRGLETATPRQEVILVYSDLHHRLWAEASSNPSGKREPEKGKLS